MKSSELRTLGLLGGMSWESTALYYKLINEAVRDRLGGLHSAKMLMYSFNMEEIKTLQYSGEWDVAGKRLADAAGSLEAAGADAIVLCTNTMHKVAAHVIDRVRIPFLHIADCTAQRLLANGIRSVALLGTAFTMEQAFYRDRLETLGLRVLVPDEAGRKEINRVIYEELCRGQVLASSKDRYLAEIGVLAARGAEAVILGCTEICMLISAADVALPTFDTTAIHAQTAADFAMRLVDSAALQPGRIML